MDGKKEVKAKGKPVKLAKALAILALIAMIDAAYLTFLHFAPSGSSFCDIGPGFSCGIVNKSEFSEVLGVPVASLGFLTFLIIFILSTKIARGRKESQKVKYAKWILFLLSISAIFSVYLIYVQAVFLLSFCILCLFLDLIIFTSLIIAIILNKSLDQKPVIRKGK